MGYRDPIDGGVRRGISLSCSDRSVRFQRAARLVFEKRVQRSVRRNSASGGLAMRRTRARSTVGASFGEPRSSPRIAPRTGLLMKLKNSCPTTCGGRTTSSRRGFLSSASPSSGPHSHFRDSPNASGPDEGRRPRLLGGRHVHQRSFVRARHPRYASCCQRYRCAAVDSSDV